MGGFRVNGCGATDHFKKIKSVGVYTCPQCGTKTEFFLEEAKLKVDVFFIPTVTIKSRYALMCGRCETGKTCPDEWAGRLLKGEPLWQIAAAGTVQTEVPEKPSAAVPGPAAKEASAPKAFSAAEKTAAAGFAAQPAKIKKKTPVFFKCSACGVTQLREGDRCSFCGAPAPAPADEEAAPHAEPAGETETPASQPETAIPAARICPVCGTKAEEGAVFCMECGKKL